MALYIEHDWPTVWLVHTEGRKVEVVRKGLARVVYPMGTNVPMIPELDKYGLSSLPVSAFFDDVESSTYIDQWVRKRGYADGHAQGVADGHAQGVADGHAQGVAEGLAKALLSALLVRGFDVSAPIRTRITSCTDVNVLQRWLTLALTATNLDAFVDGMS